MRPGESPSTMKPVKALPNNGHNHIFNLINHKLHFKYLSVRVRNTPALAVASVFASTKNLGSERRTRVTLVCIPARHTDIYAYKIRQAMMTSTQKSLHSCIMNTNQFACPEFVIHIFCPLRTHCEVSGRSRALRIHHYYNASDSAWI